jgi:hypothetical protein
MVNGNDRQEHLKILSSINAIWSLAKIIEINFFRIPEISQRLTLIWYVFTQEKWLNLGLKKTSKPWVTEAFNFQLKVISFPNPKNSIFPKSKTFLWGILS